MTDNPSILWSQLSEIIERYHRFVISSHINPDGDAIGSAIAMRRLLDEMGKEAVCVFSDEPSYRLESFYGNEELLTGDEALAAIGQPDVLIMTDAGHWSRLGAVGEVFQQSSAMKVCIDHHQLEGDFDGLRIVDVESSSASLMIYRFVRFLSHPLSKAVAEPIYLGVMVDTINFHLPNTTPEAHHAAAECLQAGVSPQAVYDEVFGVLPFSRMRLMAQVFENAEVHFDGKVGVLYLTCDMLRETGAKEGDDQGFSDLSRSIEGVSIGVYLRETDDGAIKVSWRCKDNCSVLESARYFGGGGHLRAAGAMIRGSIEEVKHQVLAELGSRIEQTNFA